MRRSIVWTVLQREWFETVRNRLLMSTILIPPVLLTVAPLLLSAAVGESALPPDLANQVIAQRPEWAAFTPGELAGALAVQQFLVFFLLMPAYIPCRSRPSRSSGRSKHARSSRSSRPRSGRRSCWLARQSRHSSRACSPVG